MLTTEVCEAAVQDISRIGDGRRGVAPRASTARIDRRGGLRMALPVPRDVFVQFLVNAARNMYASLDDAATVSPLLPGSSQLEYRDGAFFCRDVYFGSAYFVGHTTAYHGESPVWGMCYAGGVMDGVVSPEERVKVYEFLRSALRQVTPERPYRGPSRFCQGGYIYTDESQGDIERFWGVETISWNGRPAYRLRYAGGLLR